MALGALPGDVLRLVLRQGMTLAAGGVVLGLAGALGMGRFVERLLFQVSPSDPETLLAVALGLTAVSLLACYVPARRAMRADPMAALRYE